MMKKKIAYGGSSEINLEIVEMVMAMESATSAKTSR